MSTALIFILLMITTLASAKDFPVDYMDQWQSKKIDFSKTEWVVSYPSANRIFLTHSRTKTVALVTEYISTVSPEKMDEYFAGPFTEAVLASREEFLKTDKSVIELVGGSSTHKGIRYGGAGFKKLLNGGGEARFFERMWADQGKLWQISLVTYEKNPEGTVQGDLNFLMEKIGKPTITTSSFFNLIPTAQASAAIDAACGINEDGEWKKLSAIIPMISQAAKCDAMGIPPENKDKESGIKLNLSSLSGCSEGPAPAWDSMKESFLKGLNTLASATDEQIKKLGCEKLKPTEAKSIWQSIANSFAMQSYSECLSAAATSAMVSQAAQTVKATVSGIKDLYNWVAAGNNPWSAVVAIVSKEVDGFLCLNAAAQAKVVCEYATHFFIAVGTMVATAATGGMIAPVTGSVGAARVGFAMENALAAAKKFIKTPHTVTSTVVRGVPDDLAAAAKLLPHERTAAAEKLLREKFGRESLTPDQKVAIMDAHKVGEGTGRGFYTYTQEEITAKALKLKKAGFEAPEIRILMEKGITGSMGDDARSFAMKADDLAKIVLKDPKGDLTELNQTRIAAAKNFEASSAKDPFMLNESARQYILAGDSVGATQALNKSVLSGADGKKVLSSYKLELTNKETKLRAEPNNPILKQEVLAQRQVVINLDKEYGSKPAAPQVTKAPASVPEKPKAPSFKSPDEVQPTEAIGIANKLRISGNREDASKYYIRAAKKKDFEDGHFKDAFTESLNGEGNVAASIFKEARTKGHIEVNKLLFEIYDRELYKSPDKNYRTNLNKLLQEIKAIPPRERNLFTPQESMLKQMLNSTGH